MSTAPAARAEVVARVAGVVKAETAETAAAGWDVKQIRRQELVALVVVAETVGVRTMEAMAET